MIWGLSYFAIIKAWLVIYYNDKFSLVSAVRIMADVGQFWVILCSELNRFAIASNFILNLTFNSFLFSMLIRPFYLKEASQMMTFEPNLQHHQHAELQSWCSCRWAKYTSVYKRTILVFVCLMFWPKQRLLVYVKFIRKRTLKWSEQCLLFISFHCYEAMWHI